MKRTLILVCVLLLVSASAFAAPKGAWLDPQDQTGLNGLITVLSGCEDEYKTTYIASPGPGDNDWIKLVVAEEGGPYDAYLDPTDCCATLELTGSTTGLITNMRIAIWEAADWGLPWPDEVCLCVVSDTKGHFAPGTALWCGSLDGTTKAAPVIVDLGGVWTGTDKLTMEFGDCTCIPEPGSMLAMFSGLVGLVGFGIRRRK